MKINSSLEPNPLSLLQAQARYGEIRNGVWGNEAKWCRNFELPPDLQFPQWINTATGKPVTHIYCNIDFITHLLAALTNLKHAGLSHELETFDGCFMIRDIRGYPGVCSAHSFAIAIDINAKTNPLRGSSGFSLEFVSCFKKAGLTWGGSFKRCDPMHFSLGF